MKRYAIVIIVLMCLFACNQNYNKAREFFDKSFKINDFYEIKKYRENVIQLVPNSDIGYYCKAWLLAWTIESTYYIRGNNDSLNLIKQLNLINKAIKINPEFSEGYSYRGSIEVNLKNYIEAFFYFDKALTINKNDFCAYMGRGKLRNELKDYKEALKDFNKALEISPVQCVYANRAFTKRKLGDLKGALEDFNKTIELDNKYVYAYYYNGLVKLELKDTVDACLDWNKALELGYTDAQELIDKYCK